jgi:GTP-sensing pleiotropic transcriptional regulator CodY
MTKAAKKIKLKPFQKLLTIMISGKQVTKDEIQSLLGKEIMMYRISTYMWHIKTIANGVVKTIKDGRKVVGYQICNVDEVKQYMKRNDVPTDYVAKLSDLKAAPAKKAVEAPVASDELEVTEVTE